MKRSRRNCGARARREREREKAGTGGSLLPLPAGLISHYPDRWYIIPIAFWRLLCYKATAGMAAIVREKLKCSRRESKRPARRQGKEMAWQRGRREKKREKRSSRALSFEVAAGSFTFRNEISTPLALRSTLLPRSLSLPPPPPRFIPCEAPYSVRQCAPPLPRISEDHLFDTYPKFTYNVNLHTHWISPRIISNDALRPLFQVLLIHRN